MGYGKCTSGKYGGIWVQELYSGNDFLLLSLRQNRKVYGKSPIVFEHGTYDKNSASSVIHAHTHIVNINLKNEKEILDKYNFFEIDDFSLIEKSRNYIKYISNGKIYITYDFPSVSQFMRILVSNEIGIYDKYDWRSEKFLSNIISTIDKLKGE